jgi:hypothetical protein
MPIIQATIQEAIGRLTTSGSPGAKKCNPQK